MSDSHSASASQINIRVATSADRRQLARIAGRDTASVPAGRLLVAAIGDEVRAAISLDDGSAIADPFHRTAELVTMLRIRANAANGSRATHGAARARRAGRPRLAFRSAG